MSLTLEPMNIRCRDLVYIYNLGAYDVVALFRVDLDIAAGESVALVGPSGSGKSTLLSVMSGLLRPSAGKIHIGEHDLVTISRDQLRRLRGRHISLVLQGADRNLIPYLTAIDNVRFARRAAGRHFRQRLPAARDVLESVGLVDRDITRTPAESLPPAKRQQLALAVGIAGGAGVLLVDEPTSRLDKSAKADVIEALLNLNRQGRSVIVVTHDSELGAELGRTITIKDGRVGAEGRRGEDFVVMSGDGTIHLPDSIASNHAAGTMMRARVGDDGTIMLSPVNQSRKDAVS